MRLDLRLYPAKSKQGGLTFRLGYGNRVNDDYAILNDDIVIHEDTFSLLESILFKGQHPAAHWGITYLDHAHLQRAIPDLRQRQNDIALTRLSPTSLMGFMFHLEKRRLKSVEKKYRRPIVQFFDDIIAWMDANPQADGITIFGI